MITKNLAMVILLMCAGLVYYSYIFEHLKNEILNKILWSLLTGIGFAYIMGFEFKLNYKIKNPSSDLYL